MGLEELSAGRVYTAKILSFGWGMIACRKLSSMTLQPSILLAGAYLLVGSGGAWAQDVSTSLRAEGLDFRSRSELIGDHRTTGLPPEADSLATSALADPALRADPARLGWAMHIRALAAWKRRDLDAMLVWNDSARQVFRHLDDAMGLLHGDLLEGRAHMARGEIAAAVPLMSRTLKRGRELGDTAIWIQSLSVLGAINGMQEDLQGAQRNYQEAIRLTEAAGDQASEAGERRSLAELWQRMGHADSSRLEMDRAEQLVRSCCPNDSSLLSGLHYFQATLAAERGDYGEALDLTAPWVGWYARRNGWTWATFLYAIRSGWLLKEGRPKEAAELADEGYHIARQKGLLKETMDNLLALHQAEAAVGHHHRAYDRLLEFHALRDSIITRQGIDQMATMEQEFRHEREQLADSLRHQKERFGLELAREHAERTRNVYLFAGLGILLLAFGLWSRLRYTRRAKAAIEREKQISEDLLHNILPEEVAAELREKGSAEAQLIDQVTVLFTDFKGFTEYSEKMDPATIVHDLNECFSAFDRIVERYGIEKIKTIGDAYMAAGGLPTPNSTHATDVIKAAFEIRNFIAEGKARKIAAGLPYFEIRIGIHSGPVVAGIVGVKKFSYDIWGDTVNTASRMESSGEAGQVNISEATYELVKDEPGLSFTPRGKVPAKGKGEMEMFFVGVD